MGTKPTSALLPGFGPGPSSPKGPGSILQTAWKKHFVRCWSLPPHHSNTNSTALPKKLAPSWCQAPAAQLCLTAPGTPGWWGTGSREASSQASRWGCHAGSKASSSMQWCPPPKPQLLLISWGRNIVRPNALALVTSSATAMPKC